MIVDQMQRWSDLGVDGINLTWLDYQSGLQRFVKEVLPLMEQAGQRAPHKPGRIMEAVA